MSQSNQNKNLRVRAAIILAVPALLLAIGKFTGAIPGRLFSHSLYSGDRVAKSPAEPTRIQLRERPGFFGETVKGDPKKFHFYPHIGFIAACDVDADGYDDIFSIRHRPDRARLLSLYKNEQGKRFIDITEAMGLSEVRDRYFISVVACGDMDNDGRVDLVLKASVGPLLVMRGTPGGFRRFAEIESSDDDGEILGLFDADSDGYLDIYLGNFFPDIKNRLKRKLGAVLAPTVLEQGPPDRIFLNQGGTGRFAELPKENFHKTGHAQAVAFSDFNNDGHVDFFIADSRDRDKVFVGDGKGKFTDVSKAFLGVPRSRASMSASVGDINNDGQPDVYVANVAKPGLRRGYNSLWMSDPNRPGSLSDEAFDLNVDSCGWSWGTHIADLDQDGSSEILVVTGLFGSSQQKEGPWYQQMYFGGLLTKLTLSPLFVIRYSAEANISGGQKKCLFSRGADGKFRDVAARAHFLDDRVSRGVITLDFDQDGDEDVITGNPLEGPVLFENTLKPEDQGNWVAVRLHGTSSNATGIGSALSLMTSERTVKKYYYPAGNYQSQLGSEIFFNLKKSEQPKQLRVKWPSGKTSLVEISAGKRRYSVKES